MIPKFLQPEVVPVVEVVIVPAASHGVVVDVTLVPALFTEPLPRYRVEARESYWAVVDHAPTRCRYPETLQAFTIEACAIACCAALNLQGVK